ncbi:MAG TPA: C-GCAxxG-C-C family protein [Spirochaetales bacterium]|nr:C-GCAxxG-C-C family protein [Spirochaetales bacterium]
MNESQYTDKQKKAIEIARTCFLRDDNLYGCAESVYIALKTVFALENPHVSSPAIALNGGIAYSGTTCGALTGAALAIGEMAEQLTSDHQAAKRSARTVMRDLMIAFKDRFSSYDCAALVPYDLSVPQEHAAFIASGIWRTACMKQIEFTVAKAVELVDQV